MAAISDDELVSICVQEVELASGFTGGELADERSTAMDYYMGELYGDEVEGQSQVVTREVLDTVESIMPSLMRILADAENLAIFEPRNQEDEEAAQQEADRVNHEFWKKNRGFYNLYSFCKDALLSKTGNLKAWYDDDMQPRREEYKALTDEELAELINDKTIEREIKEASTNDDGTHDITFHTKFGRGKCKIEPVTPEEFGINRDARSPYAQDARFCYHNAEKTYGELVSAGYPRDKIEQIPDTEDGQTQEREARRNTSDESDLLGSWVHERSRTYWLTECYIRIDRNDDGLDELVKVTLGSGGGGGSVAGAVLLDTEEIDGMPFFTASPVLMTHKFYGLSLADLVLDLQRIKSTLTRQILNNTYLANNSRTHVNENVNIDDMMVRRPGGNVRHEGTSNPSANIAPEPFQPLPPQTFDLLNYLDEMRQDRTGNGDNVPGLDVNSLANVNSGVAAIAYDQARARIELIARILVEVGIKPLLLHLHELLQKNQPKAEVFKLRGKWVTVNPAEWQERDDMTVRVGLGVSSRERRLVGLDRILSRQQEIMQGGGLGTLLLPNHVYKALHDEAEAMGMEGGEYYLDPQMAQPQQPPEPSAQDQAMMITAQAQMGAAQAQNDRNKIDAMKVQSAERLRVAELQNSQQEIAMRHQIEALKADRAELKAQRDSAETSGKAMLDAEVKTRDQEIRQAEIRLKDQQETAKREVDMYRAVLASGTTLTTEQMKLMEGGEGPMGYFENRTAEVEANAGAMMQEAVASVMNAMRGEIGELQARLLEQDEKSRAPKAVLRDKDGLIASIGGIAVKRDKAGRVESIG